MMEQQKKQVLLVEDMPDIRELLRTVLENADYAVVAVEDGRAALEVLKTTAFDVLVSDYNLPDIRGVTLIKLVRTELPGISTVLMSADPTVEHLAAHCGAHAWFRKGEILDKLLAAVTAAIEAGGHCIARCIQSA